jgi:hypothetical protein
MSHFQYNLWLCLLALFLMCSLLLAVTSSIMMLHVNPRLCAAVISADWALYLLGRVIDGEFSLFGFFASSKSSIVSLLTLELLANTLVWVFIHCCPLPFFRHPNFVGPHNYARIVVCNLIEGAAFAVTILHIDRDGMEEHVHANSILLAKYLCLPAVGLALGLLVALVLLMHRRHWWTHYWWHTRKSDFRSQWESCVDELSDPNEAHRKMIYRWKFAVSLFCHDLAAEWFQSWKTKPRWCTHEWVAALPPSLADLVPQGLEWSHGQRFESRRSTDASDVARLVHGERRPSLLPALQEYVDTLRRETIDLTEELGALALRSRRIRRAVTGGLLMCFVWLFFPNMLLGWLRLFELMPDCFLSTTVAEHTGPVGLHWIGSMTGGALGLIAVLPGDETAVRVLSALWVALFVFFSLATTAFVFLLNSFRMYSVPVVGWLFISGAATVYFPVQAATLLFTLRRRGDNLSRIWRALRIFWLLNGFNFTVGNIAISIHCFVTGEIPDDDPMVDLAAPVERASWIAMGAYWMGLAWVTSHKRRGAFTAQLSKFAAIGISHVAGMDPSILEQPSAPVTPEIATVPPFFPTRVVGRRDSTHRRRESV